jgi:hypothetical protein
VNVEKIDMQRAIKFNSERAVEARYVVYEPGNDTRYEVLFTQVGTLDTVDRYPNDVVVTVVNFRKAMLLSRGRGYLDWTYVAEKLDIGEGDARPLARLFSDVLGR